jgi:hypothetical protein
MSKDKANWEVSKINSSGEYIGGFHGKDNGIVFTAYTTWDSATGNYTELVSKVAEAGAANDSKPAEWDICSKPTLIVEPGDYWSGTSVFALDENINIVGTNSGMVGYYGTPWRTIPGTDFPVGSEGGAILKIGTDGNVSTDTVMTIESGATKPLIDSFNIGGAIEINSSSEDPWFKNCWIYGDIIDNGSTQSRLTISGSTVRGKISAQNCSLINTYMGDNSAGSYEGIVGISYSPVIINQCYFQEGGLFKLTELIGGTANTQYAYVYNSVINAEDMFTGFAPTVSGAYINIKFVNCEFTDHNGAWGPANDTKAGMEFYNCRGVDSNLGGTNATIRWCTNESGVDITNQ